ncbi:MAG: flagellar biosynthesis protein FlhB [Candidatus Delongbacteria bacterium]|nr:flagellar biosynthesis protein FlhB [Candidatus Delongbacteria bacterium]MBN2834893.1 flagellar biosynthesis protein FlhB [Candidatus Delongbacteria bacterium]
MAENESGSEKSEQPTQRKLEKAREKGNVSKSQEINTVSVLIISIVMIYFYGPHLKNVMAQIMQTIFLESSKVHLNSESVREYFFEGTLLFGVLILPFVAAVAIVAIVANILQIGLLWTLEPLVPKFEKLFDPANFYQRFFSLNMFVQLAKDLLKTIITGYVGYITISEKMEMFPILVDMSVKDIFIFTSDLVLLLLIRITAVLVVLAVLDKIYSSWKYTTDMKMTKQEVKEEHKNYDMPKEIKQKIMQKQMQVYMSGMMKNVPKADVIITNPIHVAIAVKYDPATMSSPKVIAKGLRLIADRIRELAIEHNIPIVENPPLARSLYKKVEVDQEIGEEFFKAVAEVLAYVYKLRDKTFGK